MEWKAQWIWAEPGYNTRNVFFRFRRSFSWTGERATLHITADSRYDLYVNGEFVGQGPVRGWPQYWPYDTYDLTSYLTPGTNTIAVLVNHFGEGNFQYIPGPPGLLAQLHDEHDQVRIITDEQWKYSPEPAIKQVVPRISVQLPFEEQVDGRVMDSWTDPVFDDTSWQQAKVVGPALMAPRTELVPRQIPFLTREPISPTRIVQIEEVKPCRHVWTIPLKPYVAPDDLTSNRPFYHAYIHTQIYSDEAVSGHIVWPHLAPSPCKINGIDAPPPVEWDEQGYANATPIRLQSGWNHILIKARGQAHLPEPVFFFDVERELKFAVQGDKGGQPWAIIGPFDLSDDEVARAKTSIDRHVVLCHAIHPGATLEEGEALWDAGVPDEATLLRPYYQPMLAEHLPEVNVYGTSYSDRVQAAYDPGSNSSTVVAPLVEKPEALLSHSHAWTTIHPSAAGHDVRLLLDFGKGILGCHRFEVDAPAGTILDWHNFEFIQPDGRHNLAEGMNNSFRYITGEGRQSFESRVRRGFQYSWLTLRNMTGPVRIRYVDVVMTTYPQSNHGSFHSSDDLLNRIWEVGKNTLRSCAEDTYTDCPTYEQTHWVGDARNEALIDWVSHGDSRLWYHCLLQAGQSLDRSPLVESHVPSSWQNLLPAWSFLWTRSCREFALFTGDLERVDKLLTFVARNVEGIASHIDEDGLFSIHAWNMFDWAAMDTPSIGVVTHQNCLAVQALREAAELASWRHKADLADKWHALADRLSEAINQHLWSEEKQAYTDALRDGKHSSVFSQQTQTAAYVSGVAQGERADRCYDLISHPPDDFVKAGSPFFAFFLLEALQSQGDDQAFLDLIRKDWGFMIDNGATTFWEMWSWRLPGGRLTRSHCHGWSGAPTYFLSTHVLGVMPIEMGFQRVRIAPGPGDLKWCRGKVPTPAGLIEVQWEKAESGSLELRVSAPRSLQVEFALPTDDARVWLNGEKVAL